MIEDPDFREDIAEWVLAMPAASELGFTFSSLSNGRSRTCLRWQRKHSHVAGAFQAGPIGALADFTGASAAISALPPGSVASTVDVTVKLFAEARGDLLIATGRTLGPTGTLIVAAVDIDVLNSGARSTCATALITIRTRRPADAPAVGR